LRVAAPAEVVVHANGARRLVFVSNPTPDELDTVLHTDAPLRLESAWGAPQLLEVDAETVLRLPPYTVQIWRSA
jgi:hypothetical protein